MLALQTREPEFEPQNLGEKTGHDGAWYRHTTEEANAGGCPELTDQPA